MLTELTPECEITARLFAQGYEKKEIARMKCRALSTVNNQIQKALEVLRVRNGRELATKLYERIAGMKLTMDYTPAGRAAVALALLCVFTVAMVQGQDEMRRGRAANVERIQKTRRLT